MVHGILLGGALTSDALTGSRGLLNHVYQTHGFRISGHILGYLVFNHYTNGVDYRDQVS